jgi:hypothetical protein
MRRERGTRTPTFRQVCLPSIFNIIARFCYPLEGVFNYLIYTRHAFRELQRVYPEASWWQLTWRIWKGDSSDSQGGSRVSISRLQQLNHHGRPSPSSSAHKQYSFRIQSTSKNSSSNQAPEDQSRELAVQPQGEISINDQSTAAAATIIEMTPSSPEVTIQYHPGAIKGQY